MAHQTGTDTAMTSVIDTRRLGAGLAPALTAFALLLALPFAAARAESVVLASSLPDIQPGDLLTDDLELSLPAGASVSVITRSGQTITVTGPHEGVIAANVGGRGGLDEDGGRILQELLTGTYQDLSGVGASRAVTDAAADTLPADPRGPLPAIDVDRLGVYCVDPRTPNRFRRADAIGTRSVPVVGADLLTSIEFTLGSETADWPADLPLIDAAVYRIPDDPANPQGRSSLVLRVMDRRGRNDVDWVLTLARAGCGDQAARMLAAYREEAVALSVFVTSDRGQEPVYRIGEPVQLSVRTNRNAYVYCYAIQNNGVVVPLFPIDGSRGPGLAANSELRVPGERWPGELEAVPPPGEDLVRCYGTDRDVTDRLPDTVVPFAHVPVPAEQAGRLGELFSALASAGGIELAVAEVRVVVSGN